MLEENKVIANLENKFSKIYHERFVEEEVFVKRKSISRAGMLEKIFGMLGEGLGVEKNINNKNDNKNNNNTIQLITDQIYFYHDLFQTNLLKKIHKIKSLFYKFKYKK